MLIKSIEVKNFRSIKDECLNCDNLTVLVGRNGSGKSSFLYAIETFYDIAAPVSGEDFFGRDRTSPIEIRVTYGELREDEKDEFRPYINDDGLIVTKRISSENDHITQRYYAATLQIPQFAEIRAKSGKRERISAWNELVDKNELPDLSIRAKNADEVEQLMTEYERSHPELMERIERKEEFFGPRNIGGGKLDKFTKYVLVPAVREASEEATSKKGAIYQLLDMIVLRKVNARRDVQEFKLEFDEKVRRLYSSENLTELPELGDLISETLERFAPGSKLNLTWAEIKPPDVQLPTAKATLVEDRFEGEISRKGHGLQRALVLTLLQHLAMTVPIEPLPKEASNEASVPDALQTAPSQGPDLILAIEEPELYLHPSRCRYLSNLLLQLVESTGDGQRARNQIIYATHSPYFVGLDRFEQIRMIRKVLASDSDIAKTIVTSFTLQNAAQKLAQICNVDSSKFTRDTFRAHAISIMNILINEGFFADVVVIVEGQSEIGSLWKLQEIMKKDWPKLGIAVIPAGGKNNIDRPTVIFRGLGIPTYFIFDADSQHHNDQKREKIKECNHRYLRLAGVAEEDFPDTQVHETWAVFKENIEGLFRDELGNDFGIIRDEVAAELAYDDASRVFKNIEGAARFIENAYDKGKRIPVLEQIVDKITELARV